MEQTLSIIKPDAVAKNAIGEIISKLEKEGLKIAASKMIHLTEAEAKGFYGIHSEQPFFDELVKFMCSGPILVMVLNGENAITKNRDLMGATDPQKAQPGTIRAMFGTDVGQNAVHGSDSSDTAKTEVAFFFKRLEIHPRS